MDKFKKDAIYNTKYSNLRVDGQLSEEKFVEILKQIKEIKKVTPRYQNLLLRPDISQEEIDYLETIGFVVKRVEDLKKGGL